MPNPPDAMQHRVLEARAAMQMFVNPAFGTLASMLSAVGVCLWLTCLGSPQWLTLPEQAALQAQQAEMWQAEARRTVLQLAPDDLRPCGFVPLGADRRDARACIEHAERHGLAYWVASQAQGIDSQVWLVVMKSPEGHSQLLLDSYGWEVRHPPAPRFTVSRVPCEAIEAPASVQTQDSDGFRIQQPAFSCRR